MNERHRRWLRTTLMHACALEDVSRAIALHARPGGHTFVEKREDGFRWSPAHRGGPYPLIREVAVVLDIPHYTIILSFETVDDWTVLRACDQGPVVDRGFIKATGTPDANAAVIRDVLSRDEERQDH